MPSTLAHRLRRWIPVVAILCGTSSPAFATTYYVAPGGSDSRSGTSPANAWATVGKANATVQPGDVVIVARGTYSHFPSPAVSGTPTRRITYVGDLASPASVAIVGGSINVAVSHVTIKGFRLANGFNLAGTRDSISWCDVAGDRPQIEGADDCVVAWCTVRAQRFWFMGSEQDTLVKAERDTLADCRFTLEPVTAAGHTIRLRTLESCVLARNQFRITIAASATNASPTKLFYVRRTRLIDCSWDVTNLCVGGGDESGWFVVRDMSHDNLWVRDSILLKGPGPVQFFGAASGSHPGTVMNNDYRACVFRLAGPAAYGSAFHYQDAARWDTLSGCVIVGATTALSFNGPLHRMLVDHCTLVGFAPSGGVVNLDNHGGWVGVSTIRDCILYTPVSALRRRESAPLFSNLAAVQGHLAGNRNLYWTRMAPDSAIYCVNVGPSAPGVGRPWCNAVGVDSSSAFGSPRFADSSSVTSFDAHLGAGSRAIGLALGSTDAGAYAWGTSSADVTPPAAVADLTTPQVGDQSIVLTWTAPGDDGSAGVAAAYDLRWSTSVITAATFGQATVAPAPRPSPAGTREFQLVGGLPSGTRVYFALRARDESGNWSALGNVPAATLATTDALAPAAVQSLTATP